MNLKKSIQWDNSYNLNNQKVCIIEEIIEEYLKDLDYAVEMNALYGKECAVHLLILAELYDQLENQEYWLKRVHKILLFLKKNIECNKFPISFFEGLTEIAFSLQLFNHKSKCYFEFLSQLDNIIISCFENLIAAAIENQNNLVNNYFDVVCGISGISKYILESNRSFESKMAILKPAVKFLEGLFICDKVWKNYNFPRWLISYEEENEEEKKYFHNGNMNMGVAHGICGPALILSEAYKIGMNIDIVRLKELLQLFLKTSFVSQDRLHQWVAQIGAQEWINGIATNTFREQRASWCYGYAGISRVLFAVADNILDSKSKNIFYNNLLQIATMENEDYNIVSPTLCHGYAGLLTIFSSLEDNGVFTKKILEIVDIIIDLRNHQYQFGFVNSGKYKKCGIIIKEDIEIHDFLNGAGGCVLALISILKKNTKWEKHLLLK